MKRMVTTIMIVLFLMLTLVLGASAQPPIELKMAHFNPAQGTIHDIAKAGADWIEKRFPGRVKVTIYPAQTLVPGPASYESTIRGVCDIAACVVPGWTPGRFPKTEVIDMAPNIPSSLEATVFYWDFYKKFLLDEWSEVKVLAFLVQPAQTIHTKKKPIRTMDDLKGEKIRTYGIGKNIVAAFGGLPVTMPIPEAYEALRTGVVSGIMVHFSEMKWSHFIDVTYYHTDTDVLASPFFHIMNLKKYNSLPEDIKKALDEELPAYWNREAGKIWDRYEEDGKELVRKTSGHELILLSPEEKAKWRERAMSINGPWAAALEAKGLPGKKLVDEKLLGMQKYHK